MFDVFRGLRQAMRSSPDHLPARAEELVAARDVEGLFELVRDGVQTLPTSPEQMYSRDVIRRQLFGTRATLRGGAGSPRDKAELLRELYVAAGFEAEVVKGPVKEPYDDLASWLFSSSPPAFDPSIPSDELPRWLSVLGVDPETAAPDPIDPGGDAARGLAQELFDLAEAGFFVRPFSFRWLEQVPLVRIMVDGQPVDVCPVIPGVPFGDSGTTSVELLDEDDAAVLDEVRVRLEATSRAEPDDPMVLVEGTWSADELLGRQLSVALVPGLDLPGRLEKSISQIPYFIPTLAVQDLRDAEASAAASVVGDPVLPSGRRVSVSEEGEVQMDGFVLNAGTSGSAAEVAEIDGLEIDAGRFDSVTLRFTPRDEQGAPVEGLLAGDFAVEEDGVAQAVLLQANRSAPRVLVLIDQSASMPDLWIEPGQQEAFVELLRSRVEPLFEGARFTLVFADSRLWKNIADAANRAPTTIVFVTDGDVVDEKTPAIETALRAGPPAVVVDVNEGRGDRAALEEMAALSGGVVVDATEQEAAADALVDYLGALTPPAYALTHRAPLEGGTEREVTLRVPEASVAATASYEVPTESEAPALVGLYLTIEIGDRSVTRTLAGRHHEASSQVEVPVDARAQFMSLAMSEVGLSFEGPSPLPSVILDDVLTARLGLEPLYHAARSGSDEELLSVLQGGLPRLVPEGLAIWSPLRDGPSDGTRLSFETGPRVSMTVEGPILGTPRYARRLDVFPFGGASTADAGDGASRIRTTLEKTARLALGEASWYAESTFEQLDGEDLTFIGRGSTTFFSDRMDLDEEKRERWRQLLKEYEDFSKIVPTSGGPLAFWAIERETGALLGVLDDGSGGARNFIDIVNSFQEIMAVAELLDLAALAASAGDDLGELKGVSTGLGNVSEAIGVATKVGRLLAQLFGVASLVVAALDAYQIPEIKRRDAFSTACFTLQKLMPGGWYNGIDNTLAQLILNDYETGCIGAGG